ncbi:PREDICTED: rhythmically expressed gene 2 protein-like [Vollenhovia emeryi]|uniref:rhythmically expressed gene 2 protein-like n=1 Tax=Vollenhovia emeryi TaxID=411798 RepID=UPI0005F52A12|nr:PREDICTED: rhythmically expressed gene 2 protein-like [Vollenhovia emeryi]
MTSRVRPRLVTFDVTGTLLMTKLEHYVEIGSQHGLLVEPGKLARSFKSNFVQLSKEHPIYGKHTGLGWKNWWRTIVHNVFREQHASVSTETLDKVADNLINCYGTSKCWYKYPGTNDLLDSLQKENVILGVISNFDQRLESILEDFQIRQYFAFVLTSYDFGTEKPSLPIFEEALRLVKSLRKVEILPEEATHIGDRVDNDYFGAKSAGWNALLIKHGSEIGESKVPREDIFKSLEELQKHFDKVLRTNYITQ